MLLTALAALPTTPPGTLDLLAEEPAASTRLALLANPNTPPGAVDGTHQPLSARAVHDAVTDPAISPAARARILAASGTDNAWELLQTYPDLSTEEVTSLAESAGERLARADITGTPDDPTLRPLPWRADAVARYPGTPPDLRDAMLRVCAAGNLSELRRDELAAIALESNLDPDDVAPGSQFAASYRGTRKYAPELTWSHYLREGTFPRDAGADFLAALAAGTRDPAVAYAVMARYKLAEAKVLALLAGNFHLPEEVRLAALVEQLGDFQWTAAPKPAYAHLSDQALRALLDDAQLAHSTSSFTRRNGEEAIVQYALRTVRRDADTLTALVPDIPMRVNQGRRTAIALHPNCPGDLRAELTAQLEHEQLGDSAHTPLRVARTVVAQPGGILDSSVDDLAELRYTGHWVSVRALLVDALSAQECALDEGALRAVALLQDSYAGTVRELLDTASAVTT